MKKRKLVLPLTILILLVITFFLAMIKPTVHSRIITDKDNGATINLKRGDTLVIQLEGNPTTGYTWEALPASPQLISQVGETKYTPNSSAIGASGIIELTFKADIQGSGTLTLVYHRPWESVQPLNTYTINLIVE